MSDKMTNLISNMNKTLEETNEKSIDRVVEVAVDKISENGKNFYELSDIDILAENIKQVGQTSPIHITKDYVIVSGHRRFNAIKKLNQDKINCIFVDFKTELDEELFLISANSQRRKTKEDRDTEINNLKEIYKKLKEEDENFSGNINKMVAQDLGVSESTVKRASDVEVSNEPSSKPKVPKDIKLMMNLRKSIEQLVEYDEEKKVLDYDFYKFISVAKTLNLLDKNIGGWDQN